MSNKTFVILQLFIIPSMIAIILFFIFAFSERQHVMASYGENRIETVYTYNDSLYIENNDKNAESSLKDIQALCLTANTNTVVFANLKGKEEADIMITVWDDDGNILYSSNSLAPSETSIWDAGEDVYNSETKAIQISVFNESTNNRNSTTIPIIRV